MELTGSRDGKSQCFPKKDTKEVCMPQSLLLETTVGLSQGSVLPTGIFPTSASSSKTCSNVSGLVPPEGLMELPWLMWFLCCYWVHWGCCVISWKLIASHSVCHCDEIIAAGPSNSSAESFLAGAPSKAFWMCCWLQDSWNLSPEIRLDAGSRQWLKETLLCLLLTAGLLSK